MCRLAHYLQWHSHVTWLYDRSLQAAREVEERKQAEETSVEKESDQKQKVNEDGPSLNIWFLLRIWSFKHSWMMAKLESFFFWLESWCRLLITGYGALNTLLRPVRLSHASLDRFQQKSSQYTFVEHPVEHALEYLRIHSSPTKPLCISNISNWTSYQINYPDHGLRGVAWKRSQCSFRRWTPWQGILCQGNNSETIPFMAVDPTSEAQRCLIGLILNWSRIPTLAEWTFTGWARSPAPIGSDRFQPQ